MKPNQIPLIITGPFLIVAICLLMGIVALFAVAWEAGERFAEAVPVQAQYVRRVLVWAGVV